MSSSRRADLLAGVAAVLLGGCMKIYPDPELPDVNAEWYEADCRGGAGEVVLALVGVDDVTFRDELAVPCESVEATFADLPRERFRLEAALRMSGGEPRGMYELEVDLRNGLDERAYLYFGGFSNVRVAWDFAMGATCASLAADFVELAFSSSQLPEANTFGYPCEASPFLGSVPAGTYTVVARAVAGEETVATSPPSPEIVVTFDGFTDAGTLVLMPCDGACP